MVDRIKQLRNQLNLTMEAFGSRVGVTRAAVSNIENGRSNPSEQLIRSICREFRVSEDWLRNGIGPMMHEIDEDQEFQDVIAEISISDTKRADRIRRILRAYWAMSEDEKNAIDKLVDSLAE